MRILGLLCIALWTLSASAGSQLSLASAEHVAVTYMRHFFAVEIEKVAKLTHPSSIQSFYELVKGEWLKARSDGSVENFRRAWFWGSDRGEVTGYAPEQVYVHIVKANNMQAPFEVRQKLRSTRIDVLHSAFLDKDTAKVKLHFGFPVPNNESSLILKKYDGQWLVIGSGSSN